MGRAAILSLMIFLRMRMNPRNSVWNGIMGSKYMAIACSKKAIIGFSLLILLAIYNNVSMLAGEIHHHISQSDGDKFTLFENRIKDANEYVRSSGYSGEIGYVSDLEPHEDRADWEYYWTQYIFSPRIVRRQIDRPYVIGNFHYSAFTASAAAQAYRNLHLLKAFPDGVILFKNEIAQ